MTKIKMPHISEKRRYECEFIDDTGEIAFKIFGNSHAECSLRAGIVAGGLANATGKIVEGL